MKKTFIGSLVILLSILVFGYVFWSFLFPSPAEVPSNVSENSRVMSVENYIKLNISDLSTVKESVGGKFYVTALEAHGGAGTVSYEDGHNAYTADFTYFVSENGAVSITSWTIR